MQVVLLVGKRAGETVNMPFDIAVANVANGTAAWVAPEAVAAPRVRAVEPPSPVAPQTGEAAPERRPRGRPRKVVPA